VSVAALASVDKHAGVLHWTFEPRGDTPAVTCPLGGTGWMGEAGLLEVLIPSIRGSGAANANSPLEDCHGEA